MILIALDQLHVDVTAAVFRAERLAEADAPEAPAAFSRLSSLEEAIAASTYAGSLEGAVARVGAVSAALRAGERERAEKLARLYLRDPALMPERRSEIDRVLRSFGGVSQNTGSIDERIEEPEHTPSR